jgi:hypothetical protein
MAVATRTGSAVSSEKVKHPALTAGAAAVGLAGGIALGSRMSTAGRRKVLGLPLGRKSGLRRTAETLGKAARHLSSTTEDIRQVRDELEQANRQSPVEVLLNGLTHRRGAHKHET